MTLAEWYRNTDEMFRQTGRTITLAEVCMKIDGVFIVHSSDAKRRIEGIFPDLNVEVMNSSTLFGNRRPMILDHYVVHHMLTEVTLELTQMRAELSQYKDNIKDMQREITHLEEYGENLQDELDELKK